MPSHITLFAAESVWHSNSRNMSRMRQHSFDLLVRSCTGNATVPFGTPLRKNHAFTRLSFSNHLKTLLMNCPKWTWHALMRFQPRSSVNSCGTCSILWTILYTIKVMLLSEFLCPVFWFFHGTKTIHWAWSQAPVESVTKECLSPILRFEFRLQATKTRLVTPISNPHLTELHFMPSLSRIRCLGNTPANAVRRVSFSVLTLPTWPPIAFTEQWCHWILP